MTDTNQLNEEILVALQRLSPAQQREVLRFVQMMTTAKGPGVLTRAELQRFGGTIAPAELDRMESAIEAGCERIDPDSWDIELP